MRLTATILSALLLVACTPEQPRQPKTQSAATLALAERVSFLVPGSRVIRVLDTGSMEPALDGRTAVIVSQAAAYSAGDIVVFKHNGGQVIHRVREVGSTGRLWTKGDANAQRDGFWIEPSDVVGRVVATVCVD